MRVCACACVCLVANLLCKWKEAHYVSQVKVELSLERIPPAHGIPVFLRVESTEPKTSFAQKGFTLGQRVAVWECLSSDIPGRALCLHIKKSFGNVQGIQQPLTPALSFQRNGIINVQHKALHTVSS